MVDVPNRSYVYVLFVSLVSLLHARGSDSIESDAEFVDFNGFLERFAAWNKI